jgi:superfamily II DNA or RNA helicase
MEFHSRKIIKLFNSRTDIFALRWERGKKSGYMPAMNIDPYRLKMHKIHGGTFKDFNDKEYRSLTEIEIEKHLRGEQFVGIYPLLKNNTSWFIAADFDEDNWKNQCGYFIKVCSEKGIPAYLERSRSGNGGHVWIFFENPFPAIKSRMIVIKLLQQSGIFSVYDKVSSFDRLFPNQDFLSGKGFGNLIALPFHKQAMENNNCCFVDPETLIPYPHQFTFIDSIIRISVSDLESLYEEIASTYISINTEESSNDFPKTFIRLKENIYLNRNSLPLALMNFLRDELNFANAEYFIKKNLGKSTHEIKRYFNLIKESGNNLVIPRGFIGRIIKFCKENKIDFDFKDERNKLPEIKFTCNISLYAHQIIAIESANKKDFGVIVAPPGTGKTIIGLKIIAEKRQPALILVHRKQLADQWIERIQTFLGIPKHEIGLIAQGKIKPGKMITVAMIQSLGREIEKNDSSELVKSFGTIIVDECHHIPAESYSKTISKFFSYYIYGLTATPFRKYNDGNLIFVYLGEIISEIKSQEIENQKKATIIIRNTKLDIPFNSKTDRFETLSKILIHDSSRNKIILDDVISEINTGKRAVIITERKEHIDSLCQFLKHGHEVIALSGEDSETNRAEKWKSLKEGNYQVLITTGQYFGEGTDLKNADCLFLAYPFSFKGKLIQYIGRVQRGEVAPWIYDYRDPKIDYLNRLFLKRNAYYRKLEQQASLFDDVGVEITTNQTTIRINDRIKVLIENLEFGYGTISFRYLVEKMHNTTLLFEIENDEIRPEFDVLKPYFVKVLRTKQVEIEINAEFNEGLLISQIAKSSELDRLNKEIIDTVRFRFIEKRIFRSFPVKENNSSELQKLNNEVISLYDTESEFLEDILAHKQVKHYRQLRFLANRHEASVMKIRFVVSPFSFVFLLTGEEQYHVVMETMDTEEATYIWHVEKSLGHLKQRLKEIDSDLNRIRNDGRQAFLETMPKNFSRVLHEYFDEKKGFIKWKTLLEEKFV